MTDPYKPRKKVLMLIFMLMATIAYLLGSLSSGIIVCKLAGFPDPRTEGSRNPGATNVLRIAGRKYAALVLGADAFKGVVAVLLAKLVGIESTLLGFIVLAAILGHVFPIFFGGQGGKGVATWLGGLLAWSLPLALIVIAIWLLVAKLSRYASLAALVSVGLAPIITLFINLFFFVPMFLIAILLFWTHRENIEKLRHGKESKIK